MRTSAPGSGRPAEPGCVRASVGGQQRDEARLAAGIALVDHRPPPVDHLLLHFGRAGRAGAGDELDRGEVVAPLHLVGQAQQPHEMRRHQIEPVEPVLLDVGEQALGVEALVHQHEVAEHQALHAVGGGRRMIERRDDRGAHALLDAERDLRDLDHARELLGRRRLAHHALRPAGGAGRIGQRTSAPGAAARRRAATPRASVSYSVAPAGQRALLVGEAERGARLRRRLDHDDVAAVRHAALDLAQQVGMDDQRLGGAVAQDVAGLVRLVVPVDRAGIAAGVRAISIASRNAGSLRSMIATTSPSPMPSCVRRADAAQRALLDRGAVAPSIARNDSRDHLPSGASSG